jgi:hypothetical protein
MKKFNLTTMLSLMVGIALADGGELVTTAVTLENNKVVEEASDTAKWTFPGSVGLNVNQAYFSDYSIEGAGGSVSLDAFLNLNANYKKNKSLWENSLSAKYGMIFSSEFEGEDCKVRKNVDELILNTKYGYKVSKTWYVSTFANLETQFTQGYEYLKEETALGTDTFYKEPISHFFAPGYLKVSLGMECIPNKYFSAFISPVTARFTFCRLDDLCERYSMELDEETGEFKHSRAELGAYFKLKSDFDITKSLHFFSTLEGFYAYNKAVETYVDFDHYIDMCDAISKNAENLTNDGYILNETLLPAPEYELVHGWYLKWKLELLLKVSKYVNVSFKTQLKYDNAEKKEIKDKYYGLPKAGLQFWETTSLGIAYSF